jgi:Flp pilus assembly pilin Flp
MRETLALWALKVYSLGKVIQEEHGQAAVEYAVLLALILLAAIVTIGAVGTNLDSTFTTIKNDLS